MCRSKHRSNGIEPNSTSPSSRTTKYSAAIQTAKPFSSTSSSDNYAAVVSGYNDSSSSMVASSISTGTSLSSLRSSFPRTPLIFDFSEICSATNNFLAGKLSSSTAWRCSLGGQDVVVIQRKFRRQINTSRLYKQLALISRAHHNSLIKLTGVSISGDYIYLAYDYIKGTNLADCLRNPKNPSYTVLSTWLPRMQIATDLAHGLDYIHNFASSNTHEIHNRIKSSSIIVTEPSLNGKICHFGTAELTGETLESDFSEIVEHESRPSKKLALSRIESTTKKFEGTRGYMSPEFKSTGVGTQESDVFAFGVVMLELISGKEPLKFEFDKSSGCYRRVSVIDSAKEAIKCGDGHGNDGGGRLRRWVDWRLKDSFPVEVAREMTCIALECVDVDPGKRPMMGRVAGKISRLYMESKIWADMMGGVAGDVTVSLAPR